MSVRGMVLPLMSRQKPKILVYDEHDIWPHVEDATTCPSAQPQLHPVKLPSGKKYLIKRLIFSYDCSGVYVPEIKAHSNPYLHMKVLNVDLLTDYKAVKASLNNWVLTLQGEMHLILLVHPTLVQQPREALREAGRKLGIVEGLFHKKRPIEQAKQKLQEAEAKLKEKFSVFTLHPTRDPSDMVKEIRNLVFVSFDSRLRSCYVNASRLRDYLQTQPGTNICPYIAAVDEVGQILHQFGLTEEAYNQYKDLSELFKIADENELARSASFCTCLPPSPCSDDKDCSDQKCALFPIDVSRIGSMFSFNNVDDLRNALRNGDVTQTSELETRCFVFALLVTTFLSYHKDVVGIHRMFADCWLPNVLSSFEKRGSGAEELAWLEMSLSISFSNHLENWEKDREERKRVASSSSNMISTSSVNHLGSPVGNEEVSGDEDNTPGGGGGGGVAASPTPSLATDCDGTNASIVSVPKTTPRSKPSNSSTAKFNTSTSYAELIMMTRSAFIRLGKLCNRRIPRPASIYSSPTSIITNKESDEMPVLNLSELSDESSPLGFIPLSSQQEFEKCFISLTLSAVNKQDLAGHTNMIHALESDAVPALISQGYCFRALRSSLSLSDFYTSIGWKELAISAKRQVLTSLSHLEGSDYETSWIATATTLISELHHHTADHRSETVVLWSLIKEKLQPSSSMQMLNLNLSPTFDFETLQFDSVSGGKSKILLKMGGVTTTIPEAIEIDSVIVTCGAVSHQKSSFELIGHQFVLKETEPTDITLSGNLPRGFPGKYQISHIRIVLLNGMLEFTYAPPSTSSPHGSPGRDLVAFPDLERAFCQRVTPRMDHDSSHLHKKCTITVDVERHQPITDITVKECISEKKHFFSGQNEVINIKITKSEGIDKLFKLIEPIKPADQPESDDSLANDDLSSTGGMSRTVPVAVTGPGLPSRGLPSCYPNSAFGFVYLSVQESSSVPPALIPLSLRIPVLDMNKRNKDGPALVSSANFFDSFIQPDCVSEFDTNRLTDSDGNTIIFSNLTPPEISFKEGSLVPMNETAGLFAFIPNDDRADSWDIDINLSPSLFNKPLTISFIHPSEEQSTVLVCLLFNKSIIRAAHVFFFSLFLL